jgi:hypothetical protein
MRRPWPSARREEEALASRGIRARPDTVSESGEGMVDAEGRSRREVIRGLAAAAAGAIAAGVLSADKAEAGHGTLNAVSNSFDNPAIHGENTAGGPAVEGTRNGARGVLGGPSAGVEGSSFNIGVRGDTPSGFAVLGASESGIGVRGESDSNIGVEGVSDGVGVRGFSRDGIAVDGWTFNGTGVLARGPTALDVRGSAKFSTAASATILANQDSAFVSAPFVTALSHVTVTLTGDPGQAASQPGFKPVVVWVERQPGTGFVVHMSRPVRVDTPFTFLVVEPT